MKSQSLPMRTIIFIIIALVVVAAVVIFYLIFGGKLGVQTNTSIEVAKNVTHHAVTYNP